MLCCQVIKNQLMLINLIYTMFVETKTVGWWQKYQTVSLHLLSLFNKQQPANTQRLPFQSNCDTLMLNHVS